jgi:predicted aspartyl protease
MGIVPCRASLFSTDLARSEEIELLVDTGSTLTWVPEEVATKLGMSQRKRDLPN